VGVGCIWIVAEKGGEQRKPNRAGNLPIALKRKNIPNIFEGKG